MIVEYVLDEDGIGDRKGIFLGGYGNYMVGLWEYPGSNSDYLWDMLSMFVVGLGIVFAGGCPFRILVKSGQGDTGAIPVLTGMILAAGMAETFGISSTAKGVTSEGKIGLLVGLLLLAIIALGKINKADSSNSRNQLQSISKYLIAGCAISIVFLIIYRPFNQTHKAEVLLIPVNEESNKDAGVKQAIKQARQALKEKDIDLAVDLYYEAFQTDNSILKKWNKDNYIGNEIRFMRRARISYHQKKQKSADAKSRFKKTSEMLASLQRACK